MRQVTHALLTRPPLSQRKLQTEVICFQCFVRLACVKHAASVHPEPGSNSQIKVCFPVNLNSLANLTVLLFVWFLFWIFSIQGVFPDAFSLNFQGFKHCSIFHFQGSSCCWLPQQQLVYLITSCEVCQQLFYLFFKSFFLRFVPVLSGAQKEGFEPSRRC